MYSAAATVFDADIAAPFERPGRVSYEDIAGLFALDGSWRETPASWGNPEALLEDSGFLAVLKSCIACLPERTAQVFTMREVMELEVDEICDLLGVSPNHCVAMLNRARLKLRALLEQRWVAVRASARI